MKIRAPYARQAKNIAAALLVAGATAFASPGMAQTALQLYVDRDNNDIQAALKQLQGRDRANAQLIADFPIAAWFTGGTPSEVRTRVQALVAAASRQAQIPVVVAYNLPFRDCQQYSMGGAADSATYQAWIDAFAAGIGEHKAIVVVEPDGLGIIPHFTNLAGQAEWCRPAQVDAASAAQQRFQLLNHAVDRLKARPNARVYLDGTHSNWLPVGDAAWRLTRAGVQRADGFFLNVSNYHPTSQQVRYGESVSRCIQHATNPAGGDEVARFKSCAGALAAAGPAQTATALPHFIIDTSRNGRGAWAAPAGKYPDAQVWCNPPQRGLGERPTLATAHPLLDALLWIKVPGESDGECTRGGKGPLDPERGMADPPAGKWFKEQAAELIELAQPALTR